MAESSAPVQSHTPFEFEISEPEQKLDQMLAYWVYGIHTRTVLDQYPNKEFSCKRRFNDFFLLREALVEAHPGVIVPPVPEKSNQVFLEKTGLPIDAKHVLEFRMRALRKFLVRVGAHPILCISPLLQDFLTLSEELYAKKRKDSEAKGIAAKPASAGVVQRAKELKFSLLRPDSAASAAGEPVDGTAKDEWEQTARYVVSLEEYLSQLKDRLERLVLRRKEHCESLKTFGRSLSRLGDLETDQRRGTVGSESSGKALVQQLGLSDVGPRALVQVGNRAEHVSVIYAEVGASEKVQVVETLRYYLGMCQSVRYCLDAIRRLALTRDTLKHEKRVLEEKVRAGGADAGKAAEEAELLRKLAASEKALTECEDIFREEFIRFHREKQYDIKQVLKAYVDIQVDAGQRMAEAWQSVGPLSAS